MKKQNSIVVIGGTACGPKAACRARRCDLSARITLVEQGDNLSTATCGLPYYVSGVIDKESNMVARQPDYFRNVMDMEVLLQTKVVSIDRKSRKIELLNPRTGNTSSLGFDKLVLATGAMPAIPDWEGKNLKGIFSLVTLKDTNEIRGHLTQSGIKNATIIGAGLIGLEMAEAFVARGLKVTIIEARDWALPTLLDADMALHVEKHLQDKGVKLLFGQRVRGFIGDNGGNVRRVVIGDTELDAGLVLLSVGVKPNIGLAKDSGLSIGTTGGIAVNEFLQTSDPDIYAGGDCVENINLITKEKMLAPLGSTANKHGRIIGTNVTGGKETFPGVTGTAIAKVFDYNVGRVGLTETQARSAGKEIVTAIIPGNEHATYYPNSKEIMIKLVAEKSSGRILGGQAVGQGDTSKRIDVLATAISFKATINDLANLDLAYAPPFNSAMDPLHNAANVIRNKQAGLARALTPAEVKKKIDNGEDFILLDVRSKQEWDSCHIEAKQAILLPLPELRKRLGELPINKEIVTTCRTSIRAYQAQRILDGAGFTDVKFMDGSITNWTYEVVCK
jgi:NADPH-dependent 2,4-dienoyl-CoA reductase/sulfur reductase-like enzyme/rhodanese-related sulfurtransferase